MKLVMGLLLLGLLMAISACGTNPIQSAGRATVGTLKGALTISERGEYLARANEGDVEAMYRLGEAYCCGFGGLLNTKTALEWFCKAARKDHAQAQLEISKIHSGHYGLETLGIPPDFTLAYMWFDQSQTSGRVFDEPYKKRLMRRVGDAQMKKAREMQKEWKKARCEI